MATLNDVKRKIGAVKKTAQITKAMNMVAASKLRGVQQRMESFKPYARKFSEVLSGLAGRMEPDIHPLLIKREQISRIELLHFSSDRGLCGSFNMNAINKGEKWLVDKKADGIASDLTVVGKKGKNYFYKRKYNIIKSYEDIYGKIDISFVNNITKKIIDRFLLGEIDEVYMLYTQFVSMSKLTPVIVKLLPIETDSSSEAEGKSGDLEYLCEPGPKELLFELLPKHISVQIYNAFLQSETSEQAARMAAMDNATKNCKDLVESLTLVYNKARQAAITADLMDIVGGTEALKKA